MAVEERLGLLAADGAGAAFDPEAPVGARLQAVRAAGHFGEPGAEVAGELVDQRQRPGQRGQGLDGAAPGGDRRRVEHRAAVAVDDIVERHVAVLVLLGALARHGERVVDGGDRVLDGREVEVGRQAEFAQRGVGVGRLLLEDAGGGRTLGVRDLDDRGGAGGDVPLDRGDQAGPEVAVDEVGEERLPERLEAVPRDVAVGVGPGLADRLLDVVVDDPEALAPGVVERLLPVGQPDGQRPGLDAVEGQGAGFEEAALLQVDGHDLEAGGCRSPAAWRAGRRGSLNG